MTLSARKIHLCWCVELQDFEQIYVSEHSWWGSGSLLTWLKNLEMARCIDHNVCLNKITLRITTYTKHLQILNTMLYVELKNRIWNKKRRSDNYLRRSSKASYLTQRKELIYNVNISLGWQTKTLSVRPQDLIFIAVTCHLLWSMEGITSKSIISERTFWSEYGRSLLFFSKLNSDCCTWFVFNIFNFFCTICS